MISKIISIIYNIFIRIIHKTTIVLEINRDGQLYGILRKEIPIELVPKLRSVAYSDGMPPRGKIYADLILEILQEVEKWVKSVNAKREKLNWM